MKYLKSDFGLIFILHCVLILLVYFSPALFPWPIISIILIYLFLQEIVLGGCILSHMQFGPKNKERVRFFSYYFKKLGSRFDSYKIDLFFVWFIPSLVFILAIILQNIFSIKPFFDFLKIN
ncbi:MAG: hypothetical protein NTY12_02180 [Candidatus Falkowbacteria bacterium]|nr:hypothetical protein [Candidatus Falkowbacteria bacterium]